VAYRVAALAAGWAHADDVVQDAFVKAYLSLDRFRPEAPFQPWLLRIVTNESKNRRRSSRPAGLPGRARRRHRPSGAGAPTSKDSVLGGERRAELLHAIEVLPAKFRLVVTCRYLVDLSEAESAEVLGWPLGTVKSRLARRSTASAPRWGRGTMSSRSERERKSTDPMDAALCDLAAHPRPRAGRADRHRGQGAGAHRKRAGTTAAPDAL
jgi:RNA polymerase sigma-70 factor (ECF subfamily)